ncbi:DUF2214 family protein [Ekhidna sp.]|jgi:putative membrane protein|uniref:DUF2214 family protein n=1 Tax=Ekhidna sp. TaxID=2608089 RepID=UPI0032EDC9B0
MKPTDYGCRYFCMLNLALNTYIHLLFIITIFCTLIAELIIIQNNISWKSLKRLSAIDGIYGLSALMVVGTGLLNWMIFGKGGAYYTSNTLFLIKVSLFIVVGLLSIYPTVMIARIKKQNKENPPQEVAMPNAQKMKRFVLGELIIMACIPLLAELMANGIDI